MTTVSLPYLTASWVAGALSFAGAADAIEAALRDGLDPEAGPPRTAIDVGAGELLVMPAATPRHATVKLVTVGGTPRVQGVCVAFDAATLAPVAVIDATALTALRTAAVSLVAVRHLAPRRPRRLLVFGRGPQGRAHVAALAGALGIEHVDVVGRDHPRGIEDLLAAADVVCCCTTATAPLFDGALVPAHAVVVAIGSHRPDARETDDALAARATVVVESRGSALAEAGDVVAAIAAGALTTERLVGLADVVRGTAAIAPGRPRLFKGTGMSWQDAVVVSALLGSAAGA